MVVSGLVVRTHWYDRFMSNLQPTPIVDKNGKSTTVHKKTGPDMKNSRVAGVSPVASVTTSEAIFNQMSNKTYRNAGTGKLEELTNLEELGKNQDGVEFYRFTFSDGENEHSFVSSVADVRYPAVNGYHPLETKINWDKNSYDLDKSEVDYAVGHLIQGHDVSYFANQYGIDIAYEPSFIFAGQSATVNVETGSEGKRFDFYTLEGKAFSVETNPGDDLSGFSFNPSRLRWNSYDPNAI